MSEITLQINLSAGDVNYAALTVPALLAAHPGVAERVLVVDVCKPQRTGIVDPSTRYPEPGYSQRAAEITRLAAEFQAKGLVDRVITLRPNDPLFATLSERYLRRWVTETHDYGGCALMAYLAAFECCRTRWLLHYDADMLLHQAPGFDWAAVASQVLADDPELIAAIPRPSPPLVTGPDAPSRTERLSLRPHALGWLNQWFSTRCYLFDVERLRGLLPLLQGRIYWEMLAALWLRRGYPRSPEIMLFRRLRAAGKWRLMLNDSRAWLLHPTKKDAAFRAALPELLARVRDGQCPEAQRGIQDVDLPAWQSGLT